MNTKQIAAGRIASSLIAQANKEAKSTGSTVPAQGRVFTALQNALELKPIWETKPVIDASEMNTILGAFDKNGVTPAEVQLGVALMAAAVRGSVVISWAAQTALSVFIGAHT